MSRLNPFPEGHGPARTIWDPPPKKRKTAADKTAQKKQARAQTRRRP